MKIMVLLVLLSIIFFGALGGHALPKIFSHLDSQTDIEVTIYNNNIGLIKDKREIKLAKGLQELRFIDVAAQIIPSSVSIKSLSHPKGFSLLEQNYEYDLISPQRLLTKFVGKEVMLHTKNPYTDKEEIVRAKIISYNEGTPVFQIGKEITFAHPGRIIFPDIPEDLISKPTLIWLIDNPMEGVQRIEARYLTRGINWKTNYILVLNDKDDRADLSGWVSIDNRSGATFRNARLKLVAGDVNLVEEVIQMKQILRAPMAEATPQFAEQELFEYHIYTLERPINIKDNQTKQISLLFANNISTKKEYVLKGSQYYYKSKYGEIVTNQKVAVFVEFLNNKENNLGIPLPKGIMRVYKYDHDNSLQFIGENTIDHTPKNEKIRIRLGDAFDVVASKKQTDWLKITDKVYEAAFEIKIKNRKEEDIIVKVIEPLPGDWRILQSSHDFKKIDANTISTEIPIGKGKEVKLTYRVSLKF